ncbi:MAG TPA: putative baseplate assembly protein [Solirubrobacteraceae bacterium]|jgi:predicted phage baseplate assembly protein|nr:putative baseplate assembly protein [Solirubrobacteraceae bacterium]
MSCATPCGCCDPLPVALDPGSVPNLPGLDALRYRIGTHGSFLAAMIARLTTHELPDGSRPLAGLRSRDPSDPAIALLDAWSIVGDVLAFYQERIANEGYLRTAVERRSLLELGQLVGYRLRPGVGASAHLAFTLTHDPTRDVTVTIPAGTRAQSVPGPDERPQPFETAEPLDARESLGILLPRTLRPPVIDVDTAKTMTTLRVEGTASDVKPGDRILFEFERELDKHEKEKVQVVRTVSGVLPDAPPTPVQPTGEESPASLLPPPLRATISLQRIEPAPSAPSTLSSSLTAGTSAMSATLDPASHASSPSGTESLTPAFLARSPGGPLPLSVLLGGLRLPPSVVPRSAALLRRTPVELFGGTADLTPRLLGALRPRLGEALYASLRAAQFTKVPTLRRIVAMQRAAPFGAAAPKWSAPPDDGTFVEPQEWTVEGNALFTDSTADDSDSDSGGDVVANLTAGVPLGKPPAGRGPHDFARISLDREYPAVLRDDWTIVENAPGGPDDAPLITRVRSAQRVGVSAYQVSGTVTELHLGDTWLNDEPTNISLAKIRGVSVYVPLRDLVAAPVLDEQPVQGAQIALDRVHEGLASGRLVIVAGERVDLAGTAGVRDGELAMIASVEQTVDGAIAGDSVHTVITLASALGFGYRRATAKVYANVVKSTQGESVAEVLGGGDPTRPLQTLSLSRKPLTYLPAATAFGASSTLQVRVDDLLWEEAGGLARMGSTQRGYLVGTADDDTVSITFGTGERGARPPSGVDNVRAAYRVGAGAAGNLAAGAISQLVTRPAGVSAVLNPLISSGGADRDGPDSARENIPVSVEALERLVSVRDFEDFARARAGIGKASAMLLSDGRRRFVHLTVAGVDDAPITPSSDLFVALRAAVAACGDPHLPVVVAVRVLGLVVLVADVAIDADRDWMVVERAARAALLDAFSVRRRRLGEDVLLSDVVATVQDVPGVSWVAVTGMRLVSETVTPEELDKLGDSLGAPPPARIVVPYASATKDTPPVIVPAHLAALSPKVPDTLILRQVAP